MLQIIVSALISLGMIAGAFNYTEQHSQVKFGANSTISALTAKTSLSGSDTFVIVDNASTPTTKKITVANATSSFKAFNDLTYSPIFSTSAGLAGLLSDETGSSGGFVRAGSPTLSSPTISSASLSSPTITVGSDATGDIYYRNSGGNFTRLPIGSTNDYLRVFGGIPAWTATSTIFPSQTGKSGSFLATDGTTISWGGAAAVADYFSTTTSGTWTKPTLVNASSTVFVECWGGGGGGGGSNASGGSGRSGSGGGGAYFSRLFKASDLTSTVSITIGSGGTGGAAGNNNGNAGGNTTFGSYLTAYGGGGGGYGAANSGAGGAGGGALGAGGGGSNGGGVTTGGGPGAQTTNGSDGFAGGYGMAFNGTTCGDAAYGGGGGSRGSGTGCNSIYGGGGGASGVSIYGGNGGTSGTVTCGVSNPGSNGGNGSVPGGGGGNTCGDGVSSSFAGGNGAGGKCNVVTYN